MNTDTQTRAVNATVYVVAGQYSPSGPYAGIVRTITQEGFSELPIHEEGHFSRLYIVGAIAGLDALPEGSTVHLVCSDKYLTEYTLGRLEDLVAGKIKVKGKKAPANSDLFPKLLAARDRHAKVTPQLVPPHDRDDEHEEASSSLHGFLNSIIDAANRSQPLPRHRAKKAEPSLKQVVPTIEAASMAKVTSRTLSTPIPDDCPF